MYKIGIWGQYGDGGKIADGQAVRTTIITRELQMRYGKENVGVVNTNGWKKHPFRFLWDSYKLVAKSKKVAIAPADNGYKVFVPLLLFFNLFFRRKLLHIVIGGFLPALLKEKQRYLKMENYFSAVFVQTENILNDLQEIGVKNLFILSNPKRLNTRKKEDLRIWNEKKIKVCVFSRLNEEKGIKYAIDAVNLVNKNLGGQFVKIDLYGLIQPGYEEWLENLIKENSSIVEYKGIIDFDKTVEYLQQYFALLFPTYYYGEGFPGNVVDAYNTGLPIIATDWLYNKDVIKNGRNGILVPVKNSKAIAEAVLELYNDRNMHLEMAKNCLEDSKQYNPDEVLKEFYLEIEK